VSKDLLALIRPASIEDAAAINDIYNHYVLRSTATYQTEPGSLEERLAWFQSHGPSHPILVAEQEGDILGWGSLSPFRSRAAYGRTVEISVYIREDLLHKGLGALLLSDLIKRAATLKHHTIIAGISADQLPSVKLHEKFGFTEVARLKEVGYKFDRWLDVSYMQLML
jgi:phosphinothricin acetyltransferase